MPDRRTRNVTPRVANRKAWEDRRKDQRTRILMDAFSEAYVIYYSGYDNGESRKRYKALAKRTIERLKELGDDTP